MTGTAAPSRISPWPLVVGTMALSSVVSHALGRSTFPILLPAIESELLNDRQESGLLGSAAFGAYLVGVAVVTAVSGRMEPRWLLTGGLLTAAVGFVVLGTSGGFATLALGQALSGLGGAGIWMSAPAIATAVVPAARRGVVMGFLSSSMGLGILAVSQGTRLLREQANDDQLWRPTWLAAAALAGTVLVVVTTVLRVPQTDAVDAGFSLRLLRTVPRWLVLATGYWLFGLLVSAFPAFFALLAKDQGFDNNQIANQFSLLGLAAVVGAVNLGWVSDRIGRRPVLSGAMVGAAVAALLALVGREPYASLAIALFGACSFTFPVLVVTYVRDHLEDRAFSNALGALTMSYGVALAIGPTIAGTIADTDLGLEAVFVALCVLALASAATMTLLPAPAPGSTALPLRPGS